MVLETGAHHGPYGSSIARSELLEPANLVGTMAHELAHYLLEHEDRLDDDDWDEELLADLTVVSLGMGVFLVNSPRDWRGTYTTWPGTNLPRPAYMSSVMFGYALAHLAWWRGESKPPWSKHINWAARANLEQGLRFLVKTGQSAFRPPGCAVTRGL
jgi:hypothetical protein